jgi:alpha-1,2-mannosyltransferase
MPSNLLEAARPRHRERLQAALAYALLLMAACQIGICASGINSSSITRSDFRAFYAAGHIVRSGEALYDYNSEKRVQDRFVSPLWGLMPFFYPAYAALPFVPLSELSYRTAYFVFLALNLILACLAGVILRPFLPSIADLWKPLPVLLFLCSFPLGIAFREGQVTIILLLLYCACFASIQSGQDFRAGILLALALVKFQIALPVAVLFLVWRRWRFMAGFASAAAALAVVSVFLAGGMESYWQALTRASYTATTTQVRYAVTPTDMPNLYGLFYFLSGAHWGLILTVFCSLLLLVWAALQRPSLPLALLVGVLVSYHLFTYDLGLLLLPLILALDEMIRFTPRKIALCLCVLLLLPPLYMIAIVMGRVYLLACPVVVLLFCLQTSQNPSSRYGRSLGTRWHAKGKSEHEFLHGSS